MASEYYINLNKLALEFISTVNCLNLFVDFVSVVDSGLWVMIRARAIMTSHSQGKLSDSDVENDLCWN